MPEITVIDPIGKAIRKACRRGNCEAAARYVTREAIIKSHPATNLQEFNREQARQLYRLAQQVGRIPRIKHYGSFTTHGAQIMKFSGSISPEHQQYMRTLLRAVDKRRSQIPYEW